MADNRKMWEDLGIDLQTHDMLCAVLPEAFGDVFLSQGNRPEGIDYFNMVVADIHGIRPAELVEFQKKGGEKVLPTATCPLIKASLGARFDRTCPFFRICDLFTGETTCDGKKKAWEILAEDAPMYIMDIPQMKRPEDYEKWAKKIKNYIKQS